MNDQNDLLAKTQALETVLTALIIALEQSQPGIAAKTADGILRYLANLDDEAVRTSNILRTMIAELRDLSSNP